MHRNLYVIIIFVLMFCAANSGLDESAFAQVGPAGGLNVNVVNTPLPVQGSVNINSSPANPLNVIDVDQATRQFFGHALGCTIQNTSNCQSDAFVIPAGKIGVIEDFSGTCTTPPTLPPLIVGLSVSTEPFPFTPLSTPVSVPPNQGSIPVIWQFGRTVKLYAPAGSSVKLFVSLGAFVGTGDHCEAHLSGYFMNE